MTYALLLNLLINEKGVKQIMGLSALIEINIIAVLRLQPAG